MDIDEPGVDSDDLDLGPIPPQVFMDTNGTDISSFSNRVTAFDSGWCSRENWRERCRNPYSLRILAILCIVGIVLSVFIMAVGGNAIGNADKSQAAIVGFVVSIPLIIILLIGLVFICRHMHFANQVEEF